jgi:thioesterase domain-containing protein
MRKLANQIPITDAMGFAVEFRAPATVCIRVPLRANRNDKQTAFAGSIYSALVLAPWYLLDHLVTGVYPQAKIMVYAAMVRYHQPVTTDFIVHAALARPLQLLAALKHKETHTLRLAAIALSPTQERLASFQGKYFIARDP